MILLKLIARYMPLECETISLGLLLLSIFSSIYFVLSGFVSDELSPVIKFSSIGVLWKYWKTLFLKLSSDTFLLSVNFVEYELSYFPKLLT